LIPGFATSLGLYIEGSTVLVQLKTRGLEVLARESFGWSKGGVRVVFFIEGERAFLDLDQLALGPADGI
jgi:hypothetical protein